MAGRLGVTAPAVNKWENENSYPDITLLAPIARLLNISLDTLLLFHEDLTPEEINEIVREAKEINENHMEEMKENLLKCFRNEESFGFLKDNKRWQNLVNP